MIPMSFLGRNYGMTGYCYIVTGRDPQRRLVLPCGLIDAGKSIQYFPVDRGSRRNFDCIEREREVLMIFIYLFMVYLYNINMHSRKDLGIFLEVRIYQYLHHCLTTCPGLKHTTYEHMPQYYIF